jgi:hypothetical protein
MFFTRLITAQNNTLNTEIETIIESIIEDIEDGADAAYLPETLEELAENPVNINSAGITRLSAIPFLNEIQIHNLLEYRKSFGPIYSIYEILAVEGFSRPTAEKIEPFIYFGEEDKIPGKAPGIFKYGKSELFLRTMTLIQDPSGYLPRSDGTIPFEGNKYRYYSRYRFKADDKVSFGFTAEKDPGEPFFRGVNKYGFDFYSAHLSLKLNSLKLIIGDYTLRAGQGLVVWQGFSTGKSAAIQNISKSNQGINPYTSTDENRFFRGMGTEFKKGKTTFGIFFSNKKNDANIEYSDSTDLFFTSLQNSGYHRTQNEIADKNSIKDLNTGISTSVRFTNLRIGATLLFRKFDLPFLPASQIYNIHRLHGNSNLVAGGDYFYCKDKYQLFGEAAISKSKGTAFLQGALANLHDQLRFSLLFRHYDKNYNSLWASAFSEASSARDETGLYAGIHILPVKFVTLTAYTDLFRSEWVSYTTAAPSEGYDLQIQADCRITNNTDLYIRYKNKKKGKKYNNGTVNINSSEQYKKTRLHFQYCPSKILTLKTRFEHVAYQMNNKENGWMVFQDIQLSLRKIPLNLSTRLAFFNTESYNTRIYAYENDLLYTFSIPAYYDKGLRSYINMKFKLSKNIEIWLKAANTTINNAESIGSGYNEIAGNKKSEVKFQLRLKI